jgi:CHAD domain-containing protein
MAHSRITDQAGVDARHFAVQQAHQQLRHLGLQINRAIKSSSAVAVHDVRVAIRRFTQTIAVGRAYFHDLPKHRRIKKMMTAAGEVRNCDVALKLIAKSRVPHSVQLRAKMQSRRKESARLLALELRKWTERKIALQWRAALTSTGTDDEAVHQLAQRTLGRIAKDFLKQGNEASTAGASPKVLHRFRIAAKKFRYALELFQPLYEPALDPIVQSIKRASALLGDVNDCETVAAMVAEYKGGNRLADRLKKRQHKKIEEFRECWKEEFHDEQGLRGRIDRLGRKPAASSRTAHSRKSAA